jgi:hypothetical protein
MLIVECNHLSMEIELSVDFGSAAADVARALCVTDTADASSIVDEAAWDLAKLSKCVFFNVCSYSSYNHSVNVAKCK